MAAKLTKYFERKVGARITRSVVLRPNPIPGEVHGYRYTAEILAVSSAGVTIHLTRLETVPAGNVVAGSLVRFGDWNIPIHGLNGLDDFWGIALEQAEELDSATEARFGSVS